MGRSTDANPPGSEQDRAMVDTHMAVTELIKAGRDREAARVGASIHEHPNGGAMDPLTQLAQLGPLLAGTVGAITSEQLDRPTPCAEFTVQGVLEHMIGGATAFAAAYRGETPTDTDTSDVLAAFGPALNELAAAISAPGALERTVAAPFGELPGDTFARFVVLDGLVHGWDLATATAQPYNPPDLLVAEVDEFAHHTLDPLRDGQTFGPALEPPPNATPIERLAAYAGRRPLTTDAKR
jgi:uncharacterized protein (TIGR03086 family)